MLLGVISYLCIQGVIPPTSSASRLPNDAVASCLCCAYPSSPPTQKGPYFKAAFLVKYELPPCKRENVLALEQLVERNRSFAHILRTCPAYGNCLANQQNVFFHHHKSIKKWAWENTEESVRNIILNGLLNKGRLAILQKERLRKNIRYINSRDERARALKECNEQLVHAWRWLSAFRCYDARLGKLRRVVDGVFSDDPDLDCGVEKGAIHPNDPNLDCPVGKGNMYPNE